MVRRMQIGSFGLIGGMMLALAPAAVAGGFGLSARLPSRDSKAKNAALLVQVEGCHGPTATLSATAEGLVNGRRRSIPLRLTKVGADAVGNATYALQRQWPTTGVWVLSLTGVSHLPAPNQGEAITCRALLELGPNGGLPATPAVRGGESSDLPLRFIVGSSREVNTTLQAMAGKAKPGATLTRSAR